jgi:hypothetical protein
MTDEAEKKPSDELAALRAEVEALKQKVDPPKSTFVPLTDEEHRDKVHRMREAQANTWMPPNAVQEMVRAEPKNFMAGVVHDNRAPNTPGMIPSSSRQPTSGRGSNVPGSGTGWQNPVPLSLPPGVAQADRLMDAQDQRDRAELVEREARFKAMETMAEQTEATKRRTEALQKLAEPGK